MDVELTGKDGSKLLSEGNISDATHGTDATPLTLPAVSRENQADACRRWRNEGIDLQVAAFRDRARADYIAEHPGCRKRVAHDYAWELALATFPPPGVVVQPPPEPEPEPIPDPPAVVEPPPPAPEPALVAPGGGLAGLGDLPSTWPELSANASLQMEVGWVQANRLRVCQAGMVDLSRSLSPAPSHAALSWLETSVLYPAKWADVAVKAAQGTQDDQEDVRRERLALDDVRTLLAESMGSVAEQHSG
jgi:hypothetical protein